MRELTNSKHLINNIKKHDKHEKENKENIENKNSHFTFSPNLGLEIKDLDEVNPLDSNYFIKI